MCQIFGVNSRDRIQLNDYLEEFYSHSNEHPHGWGLSIMDDSEYLVEKECLKASQSDLLKLLLSKPINASKAFGHIRYATVGNIKYANCHPFISDDGKWIQVHNGTIFDFPPLNKYLHIQHGDSDSERVFLYVLDQIKQHELHDAKARFDFLDSLIGKLAKNNKLNYLLYDGDVMYVHSNYEGGLHVLQKEGTAVFCTVPLDDDNWKPLPLNTLFAYKDGELLYTGTPHGNTYVDNEEDMRYLYQIFAEL